MEYMTVKQAAAKWGVSDRWVHKLCLDNRIEGVMRFSAVWMIPADAQKPTDTRIKSGKYIKRDKDHTEGKRDE